MIEFVKVEVELEKILKAHFTYNLTMISND